MKKTFLTVLAAVLTIVSCHKNEQNFLSPKDAILSATIEEVSATKTFMDDNNNVRWSQGDQVVAFMKTSYGHKYNLISSFAGKTYADFKLASSGSSDNLSAGIELDHNVVYYPYSDEIEVEKSGSGYVLEVILPNEQTYAAGSFGNGSMPMVAVSENNNITFRNICGGIKLMIKGNQKVASIRIEGNDDERLSGPAVVTAYTDDRKPAITMSSEALASVTLDCGDGIQLSENSAVAFIISLPPVCFSNGFTAIVTDTEGNDYTIETDRSNTVYRSSLLVMPVIILDESGSAIPEEDPSIIHGHNPEPYFSETVELMCLLWRLAGASEYNQCYVATVANSADSYFASMKNHEAVKLAKQYKQRGISYDAVTGYGNQLIFDDEGEIIFDPDYTEGSNTSFDRWNDQQKYEMLDALNDFYVASDFHSWFVSTQTEQEQAIAAFKSVCNMDYTWFDSFYGKDDNISSRIILSFLIGGSNNGISLKRSDGTLLLTPVYGSLNQSGGNIRFNGDMNLVVHEFSHPYCNPLIEANWSSISTKAAEVYDRVSDIMVSQAYGNPRTMMCETLVRSCAVRYMLSHNQKSLVAKTLAYEESNGFMMVRSLVKVLEQRELEASKYATLADFMPVLIEAINNFDPDDESNQGGSAEPDTLPHDYVDLGLEMSDGRKLYFATRNVGETSPGGIGSTIYRWGAIYDGGEEWLPESSKDVWPAGHKLDAEHDIATIKWGSDWHTPSVEEWNYLLADCDYERKEADESGYDVAGYFFYNKSDRSKFIFLPVAPWCDELAYWTSEICAPDVAATFRSGNGSLNFKGSAGINSSGFAVRPVIAAEDTFDANGHDYVDLGIKTNDGKTLYFATMNVGETSPAGFRTFYYCWGATEDNGGPWKAGADGWPAGTKLDAAHDIATITWGEEWHIPSVEEWTLLKDNCDYERKEADESGYGVAGYFFYNRSDRSKFIFLPVSTWDNELQYWTSEIFESRHAYTFCSNKGNIYSSNWVASIQSDGFAIRPVFVE